MRSLFGKKASLLGCALLFCSGWAWAGTFVPAGENGVRDQYLVLLAEGVAREPRRHADLPTVAEVARNLAAGHGGEVLAVWEHALPGFLMRMPEGRARALARDPRVRAVEQDSNVSAPVGDCYASGFLQNTRPLPSPTVSPQSLTCSDPDPQNDTGPGQPLCQDNWGIDRIDAATVGRDQAYHFDDNGTGVHAYVLDVGTDYHREFLDANGFTRIWGGATINPSQPSNPPSTNPADWFDCTSHGTHVAGILGGRTYGVAKNVNIHPVKIFSCPNGPGSTGGTQSSAAAGLNWVAANRILPAVLSWSGGNTSNWPTSSIIRTAVENLIDSGVIVVQSAGNQSPSYDPFNPSQLKDACAQSMGGLVDEVIVVGGSDEDDGRWTRRPGDPRYAEYCEQLGDCGSNAGACIDVWAPAAHVISAYKGSFDQYCRLSGTSMAAPHVAGAVALYLQDHPNASVAEVANALRSRGTWGALDSNPEHTNWIGPGSDNVLLYSRISSVGPDLPPTARYTWSCAGRLCSFNASASTDDFGIASYSWNFGDGGLPGSGVTTTHVFAANAQSRVHLTVTDGLGRTDNHSEIITAGPDLPPAAQFTFTCSLLGCAFDGSGSTDDAGVASYSWTFGDGIGSSSQAAPAYSYAAAGSYTVTLTVMDSLGQPSSASRVVNVTGENHALAAPESYVALPPCRLFDTRSSDPVVAAGGILTSDQPRQLQMTGRCGVPGDAKAVAVNVVAVFPTDRGNFQFYPGNLASGVTTTASLNFGASNRANNAIVRLATNGAGTLTLKPFVASSGQVHMVMDVSGYFTESTKPAPGSAGPLGFQPLPPCRIADSRSSSPLNGATIYPHTVQGGSCGVPAGAEAASLLLSVAQPSANGSAVLFPNDPGVPASSTINFLAGASLLTNSAITKLAATMPDLAFRYAISGATTHAVIDTNGYFKAGAPLRYRPLTSCRLIDTRSAGYGAPALSHGVQRSFQVQGNCGVLAGAKAVFLNVISWTPTATGSITAFAAGSAAPSIPTVSFDANEPALGNGAIVPLGTSVGQDLALLASVPSGTVHAIVDVFGYFETDPGPVASFTFTCSGLTCSFNGTSSSDNVGIAGYAWSFGGSGATPSHTFTQGSHTVTLTVTDAFGQSASTSRVVSVSGAVALPAQSFFALPPCRLLDTRDTGGVLTSGEVRLIQVTGQAIGGCNIPATAKAVAVNVVALLATNRGNFQFFPGDQTGGVTATANLNFGTSNRANNAILYLGADGTVKVNPLVNGAGTVHLIIDVNGYFSGDAAPATGATGPLGYATTTPCRIAWGERVTGGTPRTFTVQGSADCPAPVPAGAAATFLNLTALTPTANGNLLVYANGAEPPTSTINFLAGAQELSNGAITALSASPSDLAARYSAAAPSYVDVHLDLHGYFKSDAALKYHPILPCRAIDTRSATQGGPALQGSRSFQIQGNCGVPVGAKAVFANVVAWQPTGNGYLTAFASGGSPVFRTVSVNASEPVLGNGAIVPLSHSANDLTLDIAPLGTSTHVIVDVFGYFQ